MLSQQPLLHKEFPDSTNLLFNFMVEDINNNMAF